MKGKAINTSDYTNMTKRIMKSQASPCISATGYSADQESSPDGDLETIITPL